MRGIQDIHHGAAAATEFICPNERHFYKLLRAGHPKVFINIPSPSRSICSSITPSLAAAGAMQRNDLSSALYNGSVVLIAAIKGVVTRLHNFVPLTVAIR